MFIYSIRFCMFVSLHYINIILYMCIFTHLHAVCVVHFIQEKSEEAHESGVVLCFTSS